MTLSRKDVAYIMPKKLHNVVCHLIENQKIYRCIIAFLEI